MSNFENSQSQYVSTYQFSNFSLLKILQDAIMDTEFQPKFCGTAHFDWKLLTHVHSKLFLPTLTQVRRETFWVNQAWAAQVQLGHINVHLRGFTFALEIQLAGLSNRIAFDLIFDWQGAKTFWFDFNSKTIWFDTKTASAVMKNIGHLEVTKFQRGIVHKDGRNIWKLTFVTTFIEFFIFHCLSSGLFLFPFLCISNRIVSKISFDSI
jgi:hypothetical protein